MKGALPQTSKRKHLERHWFAWPYLTDPALFGLLAFTRVTPRSHPDELWSRRLLRGLGLTDGCIPVQNGIGQVGRLLVLMC